MVVCSGASKLHWHRFTGHCPQVMTDLDYYLITSMGSVCDIKPLGLDNELNYPHSEITCVILLPFGNSVVSLYQWDKYVSIGFLSKGSTKQYIFCLPLNVRLKKNESQAFITIYENFWKLCQIIKVVYRLSISR